MPKEKWGPDFLLRYMTDHPGLTSTQLRASILRDYGLRLNVPEVHALIYVLRKKGKVKVGAGKGTKGGMTYEAVDAK